MNDTAIDVATEMVKELEISDWEPSEIAEMIEEQISSLVPSWKDWGSPRLEQDCLQHSFSYEEEEEEEEDDDDDIAKRPFYSASCSSSQNSLLALNSSHFLCGNNLTFVDRNWIQGILLFIVKEFMVTFCCFYKQKEVLSLNYSI